MTKLRLNMPVMLVKVSGLSSPIKRKRAIFTLTHTERPSYSLYIEDKTKRNDLKRLKTKEWTKLYKINGSSKKAVILTWEKVNSKAKNHEAHTFSYKSHNSLSTIYMNIYEPKHIANHIIKQQIRELEGNMAEIH